MKLLKLSSNRDTFHTVVFNTTGISLIVGKKHKPELKQLLKTYNGVGKSLLVSLIHFCLASGNNEEFASKVPDWEFSLEFAIGNRNYVVRRNTSKQGIVNFDGAEIELDEFKTFMGNEAFGLLKPIKFLGFRSLISRFIRPRKESYSSFFYYVPKEKLVSQLMCNSYLLGLDTNKILRKNALKEDFDRTSELRKSIKKDDIVRSYLTENIDVDLNIIDTKDRIKDLESNLSSLRVAEDYHSIEEEANELTYEIKILENEAVLLDNAIKNIDRTLSVKTDLNKDDIMRMYSEANFVIPELVRKKINDVMEFHFQLLKDREKRLNGEKKKLQSKLIDLQGDIKKKGLLLDNKLKYLDSHGALDELNAINEQLQDLKQKLEKLTMYKNLIAEYDNRLSQIRIDFENENIATAEYLKSIQTLLEGNVNIYRNYSKLFYQDRPGGIEVLNNTGLNTIRYEIDAKIQDDASDGINEVKIFCFDFTMLKAKHNHNIEFIFHDSRLFGNMDSRQLATLFKVVWNETREQNFQYVASLNEKDIDIIRSEIDNDDDFKKIITNNIILELTDESEKTKLLGIEIDMKY